MMMTSDTTISDLPTEIIIQILEILDSITLIQASKVHPDWFFIIDRYIGYDVEIGRVNGSKYWYYDVEGVRKISFGELDTVSIRKCVFGLTMQEPQIPQGLHVKNAFLMQRLTILYTNNPNHLEALLIKEIPVALKSLEICYQSLTVPLTQLIYKLNLPNLKDLNLKDTGVFPMGLQMREWRVEKGQVIQNVVSNLSALLTVHFPRLKAFKFGLSKSVANLTEAQQTLLLRTCFEFLSFNRMTILNFTLCLKNGLVLNDEDLSRVIGDVSKRLTLSSVSMTIHPGMEYTGCQSMMGFLKNQKSIKRFILSTDIISVRNILPVVLGNNIRLEEMDVSCRCALQNQPNVVDLDLSLDFNMFQNCTHLNSLKIAYNVSPMKKAWRALPGGNTNNETRLRICGYSPAVRNVQSLPKTLKSLLIVSFGISTMDMQYIISELGNLKDVILDGSWFGSNQADGTIRYGPDPHLLTTVLQKRHIGRLTLGPFHPGCLPKGGIPNGDPDKPSMIKAQKQTKVIKLIKNDNGYYKHV